MTTTSKNGIPGLLTLQLYPTQAKWQNDSGHYVMGYNWIKLTDGWSAVEAYPPIVATDNTGGFNITWNPDDSLSSDVPSLILGADPPVRIDNEPGTPVAGQQQYNWGRFSYPGAGNYKFFAEVTAGGKTFRVDPEMIVGDGQGYPSSS